MEKLNLDKNNLRKFGITMGVALLVIAGILYLRHKPQALQYLCSMSFIFFFLAFLIPVVLKPVYIIWMKLAFLLGFINTRIILCIAFYLLFTPLGLMMRLFGSDLLDKKIEKDSGSYWKKNEKNKFNPVDYEKQF